MITARVKKFFFDKKVVHKLMDDQTRKAMPRAGAFLRRRARSSIRRRADPDKPSAPGSPPFAHSSSPVATLKNILFFFDPRAENLVVGPVVFEGRSTGVPAPRTQEFGGIVRAERTFVVGRRDDKNKSSARGRVVVRSGTILRYPPREFMGPALDAEISAGTIPKQWSPALRGGAVS